MAAIALVWPQSNPIHPGTWKDVVRAALTRVLVDREISVVERKQSGPLLTPTLRREPAAAAESRDLRAASIGPCLLSDIDAIIESSEFVAEWLWIVVTADVTSALTAVQQVLEQEVLDVDRLPMTVEMVFSRFDGAEIWWVNGPIDAEEKFAAIPDGV